jgi:HK97 family phage portal protein
MTDENRALSDIVWTPERGLAEPEIRSIAWNNFLLSDENYSGRWRTSAEVRITPETAIQSTVVLACCRILAESISSLPLHVYRRSDDGSKEIARDIPLYRVLSFAPNSWQTKFEFFEQMVMTLCLWGNSYTQIKSGRYGAVSELINLHPSRMDVERLENGRLRYQYTNPETGRIEPYTQDQIMHVRWTPEPDGIKGMVPVEVAREAIALARACEIHASKYWANSARPGVVLQTDGTLSAESAERLRENWERLHRGVDRAWKTAILTGGLKAEPIGFTNEQSQYIDSRRYQSEEIARVYRLPLRLVQGQSGGNPEVDGQDFVTYTLVPWLRRIESAISRSLIYNDDLFVAEFDVRGLMRGDSNSRAGYYSTMTNLGIFSINDCRRLENMPPLENGDKHFVGMNMQTLEDAVKPKPDPMAAMMGGAPPPAQGGVPSLPEVKTGKAPNEAEQGEKSIPKEEGTLVSFGGGKVGRVMHVMEKGTLDLKSGEKIEVQPGEPVALVVDEKTGEESGVPVSQLKPRQEKRALSPQNQALYDAQEEIVRANGRWPQQGPAGAHYMEKNPFASRGIACRNCIYFEEGGSCEIVKGAIAPNAICKLWIIPEEKLQMPESRDCGTGAGGFKEGNKCAGGSDGEPVRGFRRGEGDKKQTRVARKLYQMGTSERQIKELVSQLGGKPGRSSAKVTGDKIGISVRDSSGKDKFYIEIGYNGAGVVPVDRTLSSDEAKEIESLAKQALPDKISGRLYNRGKDYPVSVHRDGTALDKGRRIAPKGKQQRAFCPTGDGGGVDNSCSAEDGSPSAGDGGSPSSGQKDYTPDVTGDSNKDGVTDAARVGVPAMDVPPPPKIGRLPNLEPHERAVESAFVSHFESDPEKVSSQFLEVVRKSGDPPTFGTDDAKCLTDAWSHPDSTIRAMNRATLNTCLHQTANAIAKRSFLTHLDTLSEGDEIMVTVGGCGAGKGFALKSNPDALELKNKSKAIWDSAGDQNATENPWILKEAEERGLKVTFVYVHADPKVQWADPNRGVVKRAADPKDGRMVDAKVFADSYAIGAKNHHAFHQANKDNPNARFVFLDNTGTPKRVDGVPQAALDLDSDELAAFAEREVEKSSAPEHVKRGALVGRRIWRSKS